LSFDKGVGAAGPPRVAGAFAVVARTDGVVEGIDLRTGSSRWQLPPSATASPRDIRPVTVLGHAIVVGSLSGTVAAYALSDRRELWRLATEDGAVAVRLSSSGDAVYVPLTNGTLLALSAADGGERWRVGAAGDRVAWPPGVGGDVAIAVGDTSVTAIRLGAGTMPNAEGSRHGR
jgi:outer membrane protein assembly factor BamB